MCCGFLKCLFDFFFCCVFKIFFFMVDYVSFLCRRYGLGYRRIEFRVVDPVGAGRFRVYVFDFCCYVFFRRYWYLYLR